MRTSSNTVHCAHIASGCSVVLGLRGERPVRRGLQPGLARYSVVSRTAYLLLRRGAAFFGYVFLRRPRAVGDGLSEVFAILNLHLAQILVLPLAEVKVDDGRSENGVEEHLRAPRATVSGEEAADPSTARCGPRARAHHQGHDTNP